MNPKPPVGLDAPSTGVPGHANGSDRADGDWIAECAGWLAKELPTLAPRAILQIAASLHQNAGHLGPREAASEAIRLRRFLGRLRR